MNRFSNKRSRGSVALIATICGCLLASSAPAAPFPGFGGPGHPGLGPFGHGPGVFVPHGRWPGHHWHPGDVLVVLGATVATVAILADLDARQRRLHHSAQAHALSAGIGERIVWEDGNAGGSVTTVRRGTDSAGRRCREFRQTVTIGDKTDSAYGTACRRSDGSWQIVL